MSRDTIIASEGNIAIAGDLYGKYVYPASTASVANVLEVSEEEFAEISSTSNTTMNEPQFWADFQHSGKRTDYSYAFANWDAESIVPIYGLNNIDKCMYALMNCTKLIDARSITFNITNTNPNMMYVCVNCNKMTNAPQFVYAATPIVRTYTSMYASCYELKTATVYWGDGTADPIGERNSCQNMFFRCYALESIDFGNENTGSPIYLDLSYAEKLTQDSVISLAKSLQDVSSAESGLYEITLSEVTIAAMPEDTRSIFESKGWTLVGKTQEPLVTAPEEDDTTAEDNTNSEEGGDVVVGGDEFTDPTVPPSGEDVTVEDFGGESTEGGSGSSSTVEEENGNSTEETT